MLKVGHTLPPGGGYLVTFSELVTYFLADPLPPRGVGSVRSGKLPTRRRGVNFFGLFWPFPPHVSVIFPKVTLGQTLPPGGVWLLAYFFGGVT